LSDGGLTEVNRPTGSDESRVDRAVPTRPPSVERPPSGSARRPPASGGRTRRKANWRKTVFRLHGWIGLNTGLLLFVICLSGTFATLSHEIDWMIDSRQRVDPPPGVEAGAYDWTAMAESIERAFPDSRNLGIYAPGASGFAAYGRSSAAVAYAAWWSIISAQEVGDGLSLIAEIPMIYPHAIIPIGLGLMALSLLLRAGTYVRGDAQIKSELDRLLVPPAADVADGDSSDGGEGGQDPDGREPRA